ncbi:MAG: hypothetical protein LBG72_09705 [Spirochaetaceae bacterium]|jgi:hypothetical protein|nr:hypothetical protein [Spirochaetaceae bacterium]
MKAAKFWLVFIILITGTLFTNCELDPEDEPETEQGSESETEGNQGEQTEGEPGGQTGEETGGQTNGFPQTLNGTIWQWQHRAYFFYEDTVDYHRMAEFGGSPPEIIPYSYTYTASTGRGEIDYRGKFRLQADGTMFFPNYSNYGHNATFVRVEEAIWQ